MESTRLQNSNTSKDNVTATTVKCPRCNNTDLRKAGVRLSVTKGTRPQYQCKKCAHIFVAEQKKV